MGEDRWAGPVVRSRSGPVLDSVIKNGEKNNRGKNIFLAGKKRQEHMYAVSRVCLRPAVHGPRVLFSLSQNGQGKK